MNRAALVVLLAACFTASAQTAPPDSSLLNPPFTAERIETGMALSLDGFTISYRIRLLPLASFPDMPPAIAAALTQRQCMIPQSFEAQQPENVIHGSFRAPGTADWAALCSSSGSTTLFVFFAGQFDSPIALRSQSDTAWLGAEPGNSTFGSSWGIAVRPAAELRSSPELRRSTTSVDHDAIDDARLERSLTVHYFQAGKWLRLNPGDSSD